MVNQVLFPALVLGGIALVLGAILAVASVIFKVDTDERIGQIEEALPGANCGGCGFAGCSAYAAAIVAGEAPLTKCAVGGEKAQAAIADIMGMAAEKVEPKRAFVQCGGDCDAAALKFDYNGISDCAAAMRVAGGPKGCEFGCLGYGTCVSVCKFDAISIKNGIAVVDPDKCVGCGTCVNICPRHVIKLRTTDKKSDIKCKSTDKGALVRKYCKSGCLACGICAKNCPQGAITVDGVAKFDHEKCVGCGTCVEKCPAKCIELA
ncbi:MAG: RnfABCDGE type electron transport complex subunit B [Clostridia bacterium]|nr:RnfABCDGE type electron transport complex subunit B [Clostridia bacterium]